MRARNTGGVALAFWLGVGAWVLFSGGCRNAHQQSGSAKPIVGIKIYDNQRKVSDWVREWKKLGINTVFASVDLNRNEDFRRTVKRNGMTRFIILPIFYDPDALAADSTLFALTAQGRKAADDWVTFVCPSRESFRKQKIESIRKLIRETDPDGLSLDFIRHFVFWEMVYPDRPPDSIPNTCFDAACMERFQNETGIRIPGDLKSPQKIASWIQHNHHESWTKWKCALISGFVRELAAEARKMKPHILINVHAVPWRREDFGRAIQTVAGQDFSEISKYCDYLSPMTYAHMVKQKPVWVHSVVEDMSRQAVCRVLPSIQVEKTYLENALPMEEFAEYIKEALKPPSAGVVFWSWEALERQPEKKEVIQNVLKSLSNRQ